MFSIIILTFVIVMVFTSCASYKFSNKHKNEELSVKVDTALIVDNSQLLAQNVTRSPVAVGGLDITGRIINYAAIGIKKLIELSKKNLTVQYSSGINNLDFYDKPSSEGMFDPRGMKFKGLVFNRNVDISKKDTGATALYLDFTVDTTDKYSIMNNSIFRLKLDSIQLNYAKARIPGCKWYMPWTVFWAGKKNKKLNMDVEIVFTSSWIDDNNNIHRDVEIGRFLLPLRNMPLDKNSEEYKKYFNSLNKKDNNYLSGYCFLVPRSYGYYYDIHEGMKHCYGQGIFNVSITIKEAGKEKFITKMADKSGPVIEEILDIIKDIRKK